jgi:hypothetical protein
LREVIKATCRNGKCPGIVEIPNEGLKKGWLRKVLLQLFYVCLKTGLIPSLWRKLILKPIPKGSMADPYTP